MPLSNVNVQHADISDFRFVQPPDFARCHVRIVEIAAAFDFDFQFSAAGQLQNWAALDEGGLYIPLLACILRFRGYFELSFPH
jgi:hypothetical protein